MASPVVECIQTLQNFLTPVADGGLAANLSFVDEPYFNGGPGAGTRYTTELLHARFFNQDWEVPISNLEGTTSTGILYIYTKPGEDNEKKNINDPQMRYRRKIPLGVAMVTLHEGTVVEYEEIFEALLKDALQNVSMNRRALILDLDGIDRMRPEQQGIQVTHFRFSLTVETNLRT